MEATKFELCTIATIIDISSFSQNNAGFELNFVLKSVTKCTDLGVFIPFTLFIPCFHTNNINQSGLTSWRNSLVEIFLINIFAASAFFIHVMKVQFDQADGIHVLCIGPKRLNLQIFFCALILKWSGSEGI